MTRLRGITVFLLLTTLLVAGQVGAALHAFEHDVGAPPGKVCSTCVTGAQLGAAAADNPVDEILEPPPASHGNVTVPSFESRHDFVARQRGPPAAL